MAKFCTKCGAAVKENSKFCASCGHIMNKSLLVPNVEQADQSPYIQQQGYGQADASVQVVAKKKNKIPMIIYCAVLIVVALVVLGIITKGFGLFGSPSWDTFSFLSDRNKSVTNAGESIPHPDTAAADNEITATEASDTEVVSNLYPATIPATTDAPSHSEGSPGGLTGEQRPNPSGSTDDSGAVATRQPTSAPTVGPSGPPPVSSATPAPTPGFPENSGEFEAAYIKMIENAPGETVEETEVFMADLLTYRGILPDSAVSSFISLVNRVADHLSEVYWNDDAFYEKLRGNSFISARLGEGGIGYGVNYTAINVALTGRLSPAYNRYLGMTEQYLSNYLVDDMALMISWDDLAQWIVDLSSLMEDFPDFIENEAVNGDLRFALYLFAGCFNLDNTPVIDYNDQLSPEVKASYEKFLANPESKACGYYDDIETLYNLWDSNNFRVSKDVSDFIKELEERLYL
ncbi:MAG: zinc-ribbon domain-containing protein [Synergistaceae bacterium]|nr:zinc-ribbon domain-containing protein [Synergistaceae bacterium]